MKWSGDDWQDYCNELMTARHGADYQRIPDARGDYGAEGYTADGTLVQAYASEEVVDHRKLYEAQRNKVSRDVAKVVKNRAQLAALAGGSISRVIFMVPELRSKDLLQHCASKAEEVRNRGLAEFSADFDIRVLTADDFPEERRRLGESVGLALAFDIPEFGDDDIAAWEQSNSELTRTLERKLGEAGELVAARRAQLGTALLRLYLRREETLRQLRVSFPALWESALRALNGREHALAAENLLSTTDPQARLTELASELESRMVEVVPSARESATDLGWGTVAEWLLRCPLELGPAMAR